MGDMSRHLHKFFQEKFTHPTQRYHEIPQPPLSESSGDDGCQQAPQTGKLIAVVKRWRNTIISFFLGFSLASAIAVTYFIITQPVTAGSRFTFTRNWAGVGISTPPSNQRFSAAQANLTLPSWEDVEVSDKQTPGHSASVWVGIDIGDGHDASLRTGLTLTAQLNGPPLLEAFYQWGLNGRHAYTKIGTISAGDTVQFELVLLNHTFAKAEVLNFDTGKRATKFWSQSPSTSLARIGQNVAWILEDETLQSTTESSLLDFGRLTLEHCIVWTNKDELLTAANGDIYRIRQNGVARTGVHVEEEAVVVSFIE